jgi:teichuronic acid biosynthesis glycosyltransferase TuaG
MYNVEKYIGATIVSVQAQTYGNWEMLIADDCSTDKSNCITSAYVKEDHRIKLISLETNSGVATARNAAISIANGRFIAFLDADDLWHKDKLQKQVLFMLSNDIVFSCVSYEVVGDDGKQRLKTIHMKDKLDYKGYLTNNYLQTLGIMADISIIDKQLFLNPLIKHGEDAAAWLQVLKAGYPCYGLPDVLASYRKSESSLTSSKKHKALGTWRLYREIENLSLPFSCYCFVRYAFLAVWKRMYRKGG